MFLTKIQEWLTRFFGQQVYIVWANFNGYPHLLKVFSDKELADKYLEWATCGGYVESAVWLQTIEVKNKLSAEEMDISRWKND